MKKYFIRSLPAAGIAVILVILAFFLFQFLCPDENAVYKKEPIKDPLKVYTQSLSATVHPRMTYHVDLHKETIINDERFNETRTQTIAIDKTKPEDICMSVKEQMTIGAHSVSITEIYKDNVVYLTVDESKFRSNAKSDEYTKRFAPMLLIDAKLYGTVNGYVEKEEKYITFEDAKTPEKWLWDKDIHFKSANGQVQISKNGMILASSYTVRYIANNTHISMTVTTKLNENAAPIKEPENPLLYTAIANPDAPKLLEKACGYLTEASSIHSEYKDYIECTAFEDRQSRTIEIDAIADPNWSSRTHTTLTYQDHSKAGSDTVIVKDELYIDGKHSIQIDGGEPVVQDTITENEIRSECRNTFVGTIMLPEQIKSAEITETPTTYDIVYTANAVFADQMRINALKTLYQDPDILSEQTESYKVDTATCYLKLDKATGLPVASGFCYIGTYQIDTLPYRLEFRADQQYEIQNDSAQNILDDCSNP